jgi:hypothetical protein
MESPASAMKARRLPMKTWMRSLGLENEIGRLVSKSDFYAKKKRKRQKRGRRGSLT